MIFVIISSALFLGLLVVLFTLARRIMSAPDVPETATSIDDLSIDHYRPMLRLLDGEDFQFLRSQPGFTRQMARKLRIQRCQTFRGYLDELDGDFKRVSVVLKMIMAQSTVDRPDLAVALVRGQVAFAYGMLLVQLHLVGYRYGIGTVDVSGLVKIFDGVRLELQTLVPAELGAAS